MASESSDEKDGTLSLKRKDLFFPVDSASLPHQSKTMLYQEYDTFSGDGITNPFNANIAQNMQPMRLEQEKVLIERNGGYPATASFLLFSPWLHIGSLKLQEHLPVL